MNLFEVAAIIALVAIWVSWWQDRFTRRTRREAEERDAKAQQGPTPPPKPAPPGSTVQKDAPPAKPSVKAPPVETVTLAPGYGIPGCKVTVTGLDPDLISHLGPMLKPVPPIKETTPMTDQPPITPPPTLAAAVEATLAMIRPTANVPQVTDLVKTAAAGTDAKLIFDIGDELCNSNSKHFNRNIPLALTWLGYAAEKCGHARAWEDIGDIMLAPEMPAQRDYAKAFAAYDKARDNSVFAQTKYALCLLLGVGCDRDDVAGMIEMKAAMDRNETYYARPIWATQRMSRGFAHYFMAWSELSDIAIGEEVLLRDMQSFFSRNKPGQRTSAVSGTVTVTPLVPVSSAPATLPPDYKKMLDEMIGLGEVKNQVRRIAALVKFQQDRKKASLPVSTFSMHMVFTGNPGTGKTTVARVLGGLFKEVGYLKSGHVVETSAADLIAEYVGQTAQKTTAKLREALGGILHRRGLRGCRASRDFIGFQQRCDLHHPEIHGRPPG